jgi:hypothetical protein
MELVVRNYFSGLFSRKYGPDLTKKTAFWAVFLFTIGGPDGDRNHVQLTNRSIAIFINKYPIQFCEMEEAYIHCRLCLVIPL